MAKGKNGAGNRMEELVRTLAAADEEYTLLRADREEKAQLGKPSTPAQLAKLETIIGKALPPSVRAFYELYNGWDEFDGDGKILAVEDHKAAWLKKSIGYIETNFAEFDKKGPFESGGIPLMVGPSIQNYVLLDPGKVRPNGEMNVVSYDSTEKEDTFKDLYAFFEDRLETTQRLLKPLRSKKKKR